MNKAIFPLVLAVAWLAAGPANAAIKCWTNNEGVRECGNVVPPEYAQQGHEEYNRRGIVVEEKERAKTDEELAEERRIAEEKAAAEKARQEAEAADRVLLATFSSVDDLELARDGRLTAIDSQIRLTENQIEKLEDNLASIIQSAADLERQGRTPPDTIKDDISSVREQIARKQRYIADKQLEKETVRASFDADIARFRELKGGDY